MLIYTYLVTVETTLRRYARHFSFTSQEEAQRFKTMLAKRFGGLQPRMTFDAVNYVADAAESLAVFEREINEKP